MRSSHSRWYAPLLENPRGATLFIREMFPDATFHIEKRQTRSGKMLRIIRFDVDGHTILRARSEVFLDQTDPALARVLEKTDTPIGEAVEKFRVRRTRLKSTSRTRAFHFFGDLHATIWERFYVLPAEKKSTTARP